MRSTIKRLLRPLVRPLQGPPLTAEQVAAVRSHTLDSYTRKAPSPQNALDIFAGEWSSRFPPPLDTATTGHALLFDDPRAAAGIEVLGGVRGRRVLELGPLEGAHTYMLDRAGASEIVAIESNTRAFLKCLITKELLSMPSARFLCGDFMKYLRDTTERFDVAFASGVLYHMVNPVELIEHLSRVTNRVYLWTHYYDRDRLSAREHNAHRVVDPKLAEHAGFRHHLYVHYYEAALDNPAFCGGSLAHSHWMLRADILGALHYFGFTRVQTAHEDPEHTSGPCFSITAIKQ